MKRDSRQAPCQWKLVKLRIEGRTTPESGLTWWTIFSKGQSGRADAAEPGRGGTYRRTEPERQTDRQTDGLLVKAQLLGCCWAYQGRCREVDAVG